MWKTCKNGTKPNNVAKMCRSQQVNVYKVAEDVEGRSEDGCNIIQNFDFCDEFEIISIEYSQQSQLQIEQKV